MPRPPLGIAIVGAGAIASAHAYAAQRTPNAELVGVTSRTPEAAQRFAVLHGVRAYPDLASLVADPAVQLVAICTPSGAHLEPARTALRAGKHVIVEKPLEITSERTDTLLREARKAGVTLSTVFMSRFADANAFLERSVREGRLGRLLQGDAYVKWYRDQAYYDQAAWRGTWRLDGGGALMNQAIHQVDLLLWIMGPVREVFAYGATLDHDRIEVEDTLVAVLRYESGALGQISAATSLWPGRAKELHVHGTEASAIVRDDVLTEWRARNATPESEAAVISAYGGRATGGGGSATAISFENHTRQYADVIEAILNGRASLVSDAQGAHSVRLVEAIYASIREGTAVRVT